MKSYCAKFSSNTVSSILPDTSPLEAVIVTVPFAFGETVPLLTVAIVSSELFHVNVAFAASAGKTVEVIFTL